MSGFTKLWAEITDSSIWNEDDKTRIVWITMLARMGPDYVVRASVGGLAHLARVSREDCEKALEKLASPDPDSRSPEEEGRRIKKVEGGFFMINGEKFRQRRGDEEKKAYMREYMRQYRKNKSSDVKDVKNVNIGKRKLIQEEEEEEAEEEAENISLKRERGSASQTDFAEIPTLEEVIAEAEARGIPDEHARSFWEYNESKQLWVNQYGKMIKWKMALKSWSERRRTMQPNGKQSTGYKKIEI
jgi:hypothetical protein